MFDDIKETVKLSISLIISLIIIFYMYNINKKINKIGEIENILINLEQPECLMSDDPEEDLMNVLDYYKISNPEIVYAQAVLETGNFKSIIYKKYNNLFGLYDSRIHDYYKFNHWSESVFAYKMYIQYKYKYNSIDDYYTFLNKIGYAEDSTYTDKLKQIVKKNDKR